MEDCPFCPANSSAFMNGVLSRNPHCLLIRSNDAVLQSSMMIIPRRHVGTPFDLTQEEWMSTWELLTEAKRWFDHDQPDGYSIGWNVHPVGGQSVLHAHLHVIGRFADEPLAGQGIRHALKQPQNRRPKSSTGPS